VSEIEARAAALVAIAKEYETTSFRLHGEAVKLRVQLADALDAIHELKSQIITKDNIIAELQVLQKTGTR
jgi:hypothetical protein